MSEKVETLLMRLTGNEVFFTRQLYDLKIKPSIVQKLKERKKQHKLLKKQQKRKKAKRYMKKKEREVKMRQKCIEMWGCDLEDKFVKRVTYAGGDFQSLGEVKTKVSIFKGRKKCYLIASYLNWGSWGSTEIDYYLHRPSGWILSVSKTDTQDSCCDNQDVYIEKNWKPFIEVTDTTKLYFI